MPDHPLQVPPGTRLVHIGPPKSGSTAIQNALKDVRSDLPALGVVYPGRGARPRRATWAVLGIRAPMDRRPVRLAEWRRLVEEVDRAGESRVCVSDEDLARADDDTVARVVQDLGGERVHVVAVARRLDRVLPSMWQERVKAMSPLPYHGWLQRVLGDDENDGAWRLSRPALDLAALVRRWAAVVGPQRFTLVVVDETDRELLPRTFERLLGLPEGLLAGDPTRSNTSLSHQETELVRGVNQLFRQRGWPRSLYRRTVQKGMVAALSAGPRLPGATPIPPLPGWAADRLVELSTRRDEAAAALGIRVIGDLTTLRPIRPDEHGEVSAVLDDVPIGLAATAVGGVIEAMLPPARRRFRPGRRGSVLDEASALDLARALATRAARRVGSNGRPR